MMEHASWHLADADATVRFAEALARALGDLRGGVLFLHGDLGAGKTTLARSLLRALGATGTIRSPTYTLLEPYELPGRRVLHMDLYRLQAAELDQLGLEDYPPAETLWLVEWPERGLGHLPDADLRIRLAAQGSGRRLELSAAPSQREVLRRLQAELPPDFT